jgi:hypothetical protein
VQSIGRQKQFYKIAALSMIVAGSVLLIFSVADVLAPRATCHDNLDVGADILMSEPAHCIDLFEMPSSNSFILIILAICLQAFGGAIIGMITRLS